MNFFLNRRKILLRNTRHLRNNCINTRRMKKKKMKNPNKNFFAITETIIALVSHFKASIFSPLIPTPPPQYSNFCPFSFPSIYLLLPGTYKFHLYLFLFFFFIFLSIYLSQIPRWHIFFLYLFLYSENFIY